MTHRLAAILLALAACGGSPPPATAPAEPPPPPVEPAPVEPAPVAEAPPPSEPPVADSTPTATASGSQAEIAEAANQRGVVLVNDGKFAEAAQQFRDAVARVPLPKYFFNLCTALFQEGRFGDALTACNGGKANQPSPDLLTKLDRMIQRIRDEAKRQGITLGN